MAVTGRAGLPVPPLPPRLIDPSVVTGAWKRLVFGHPARDDGLVDRNAYVFCVLEQFHRHLKRRDIYAAGSSRWRDPNAQLLEGTGWATVKDSVLTDLGRPSGSCNKSPGWRRRWSTPGSF